MAETLRKRIVNWAKRHNKESDKVRLGLTDVDMNLLIEEAHSFRFSGNRLVLFFEDDTKMIMEFEHDPTSSQDCAMLYECGDYKRR